ncbi:bZIP transcription factor [Pseudomonas tohonis]|nr:bZIP transcription factor [Pseudomonas tohonis]
MNDREIGLGNEFDDEDEDIAERVSADIERMIRAAKRERQRRTAEIEEALATAEKLQEEKARLQAKRNTLQMLSLLITALGLAVSLGGFVYSLKGIDIFSLIAENNRSSVYLFLSVLTSGLLLAQVANGNRKDRDFQTIDRVNETRRRVVEQYSESYSDIDESDLRATNRPLSATVAHELAVQSAISASKYFERCISETIKSLDDRISLAEEKSSVLLDTGTMYLRRGIYFYVFTIVAWQFVYYKFDVAGPNLWLGVVSCSLTFLVIEFLAAWYLKQYRSYVDSSVAYLRVRSTFSRYLLSYYAIREFEVGGELSDNGREQLLKVLEEQVKWPELKDLNRNDFNYMVEMLGSVAGVFEKFKGVLNKDKTT